jgi:hypothetical protein
MKTTTSQRSIAATRGSVFTKSSIASLGLAATVLAGCSDDRLNIVNPNTPGIATAGADPQALQLQATGLLFDIRANRGGFNSSTGIFGREMFNYTPQEPRNVTNFLIGIPGANQLDRNGFANGNWGGFYNTLRDSYNFKTTLNGLPDGTVSQIAKRAALGFSQTIDAYEMLHIIASKDTLGAVVQINADPQQLAPFVSRDSVYKWILGTLDEAAANLAAGGTAFPFNLTTGFAGFNNPTTFRTFNRAIAARAAAYYATAGGGAAAWQRSLDANIASYANVNATTRAALDAGPIHTYGAAPDVANPQNTVSGANLYAHPSIRTDVPKKADGTNDNRYIAKVGPKTLRTAPGGFGISSDLGFIIYPVVASPIGIIRNEELMLLRAEAYLALGNKAQAIEIINSIRVNSGGLVPSTLTTASSDADILTELLLQKRYSLLLEGHRWVDLRRYNRLGTLPLDIPDGPNKHFVPRVQPIPGGECLVRVGQGAALAAPGCPP